MAPSTIRNTKLKPEKTELGEATLDLVMSYISNVEDQNSVSLVSRKFYETDRILRKTVTLHTHCFPDLSRLNKRFLFIETLTLEGHPYDFSSTYHHCSLYPYWIEKFANLEFRYLKGLHIRHMFVRDNDLETLARTRGKDLRSLKIKECQWFSTDGLRYVSKYCKKLTTFCFTYPCHTPVKDGIWLHLLALNSTVLERFHVTNMDIANSAEDLTLLAKNCSNSLISLKVGGLCYLSKLRDAFRYAVRLEHFSGNKCDDENELVGFRYPPNMRSLGIKDLPVTCYSSVLPFSNHIRKLKHVDLDLDYESLCLFFKKFPNLEVLYTREGCGDNGLLAIGELCPKLRKITYNGLVTYKGVTTLARGCTNLECLQVRLEDTFSNETIMCLGTHLKNLRKFRLHLVNKDGTAFQSLDNGLRDMLTGCNKLERLDMIYGGLTDVGLDYIGKYGANLRALSLIHIGDSDAGLVHLSKGCKKLRKLKMIGCPFSKLAVTSYVFNMPVLRYVYFDDEYSHKFSSVLFRPRFHYMPRRR